MVTSNGLVVPGIGEGGRPGRPKGETSTPPRIGRRVSGSPTLVQAEDVRAGDTLVGGTSRGVYAVLGLAWTRDHQIALTVQAPSGTTRTWIRDPHYTMERA